MKLRDDLVHLAHLVKQRNSLEEEISAITGRPAAIGHLGEYVAAAVLPIRLVESASHKSIDGFFTDGPLSGRSVNVKWYARQEGILDITADALPDFYLVLAGPRSGAMSSRGQARPWTIESVYLFEARLLTDQLRSRGVKIGVATSVGQHLWREAEIYPSATSTRLPLSQAQREMLALFR